MEMLNKLQSLLNKNRKKEVISDQKADKAPKTNESKSGLKKSNEETLKDKYGTTHLFI